MTRPPAPEQPTGYEVRGENGTLRVTGALPHHECHTGEVTGHVNVGRMWEDITKDALPFPVMLRRITIDAGCLAMIANQDIDPAQLERITWERSEIPGIAIAMPDGTHCLVDGSHRLFWRHKYGARTFDLYEFPSRAIDHYRVRFRYKPRGSQIWRDIDPQTMLDRTKGTYPIFDEDGRVTGHTKREPKS